MSVHPTGTLVLDGLGFHLFRVSFGGVISVLGFLRGYNPSSFPGWKLVKACGARICIAQTDNCTRMALNSETRRTHLELGFGGHLELLSGVRLLQGRLLTPLLDPTPGE